ncbi:MAG TPA: TetR/AcrR family transcriptional regulator [Microthrixaceae bacterium]|nr:TetR/AcrR family transcriptional regulator [Microthrixaceae bacterium]
MTQRVGTHDDELSSSEHEATKKFERKLKVIIDAAAVVFRRKGYDATSLSDIADEVGLSRVALYYYVSSKEDLLRTVIKDAVTDNVQIITAIAASDLDPMQKLIEALGELMEAYDRHYPHLYVYAKADVDILERDGTDETAEILQLASQYITRFTEIIEEGGDSGSLALPSNPGISAWAIVGMLSWSHRWYKRGGPLTATELGTVFADLVINGLAPRDPRQPIQRVENPPWR